MLLVIERERDIFVFGEKRKKERKKETLFRPSIDEIPLYLLSFSSVCVIILLDNHQSTPL